MINPQTHMNEVQEYIESLERIILSTGFARDGSIINGITGGKNWASVVETADAATLYARFDRGAQ